MSQTIQIKRGNFANLPASAAAGELLWTLDTNDLYVGTGTGLIKSTVNVEANYIPSAEKGTASGVATLDASSKIPVSQLPALAITDTFTAADATVHQALVSQKGDVVVRTDENKSYICIANQDGTATDLTGYQELLNPTLSSTDLLAEGTTNLYFTNTRAQQAVIDDASPASTTTGYSASKIESIVSSSLTYKGAWDASTNTPTLSDGTGTHNDYYKVSVAGTQNLGSGSMSFSIGDDVIHNGTVWERFGSSAAVDSVNTKTGIVVLGGSDILATGYTGSETGSITATDSINAALAKVENAALAGNTDLSYTASATQGVVVSSSGTDATLPVVDGINAGLMIPADKTKLDTVATNADVTDLSIHNLSELQDTTFTLVANNDLISWNGTAWVNQAGIDGGTF